MLAKEALEASGHGEATGSFISPECRAQRGMGQLKELPPLSEVFPWCLCSRCLPWSKAEALAVASFTPAEARLRVLSWPHPHLSAGESPKGSELSSLTSRNGPDWDLGVGI